MSESETTLREEDIRGETSWSDTRSETGDTGGDDMDTTDFDLTNTRIE